MGLGDTLWAPGPRANLRGRGCRMLGQSTPRAVRAGLSGYVYSELSWGQGGREATSLAVQLLRRGGPGADPRLLAGPAANRSLLKILYTWFLG